jgi:hypothetical protein
MKTKFCTIGLLLVLSLSAQATLYTFSGTPTDNGAGPGGIPDNNTIGLSESQTLSGLPNSISAVTLNVTLSGGLGSDLMGYLRLGNLTGSPSVNLTGLPSGAIGANMPVSFDLSSTFSIAGSQQYVDTVFLGRKPGWRDHAQRLELGHHRGAGAGDTGAGGVRGDAAGAGRIEMGLAGTGVKRLPWSIVEPQEMSRLLSIGTAKQAA